MNLTNGQCAVLTAFREFGPMTDVALAVYVHHVAQESMSSSGIRSRRAELVAKGLLDVIGTKAMKSGRRAAVHQINAQGQKALNLNNPLRLVA